jgi:hypothetical protein
MPTSPHLTPGGPPLTATFPAMLVAAGHPRRG